MGNSSNNNKADPYYFLVGKETHNRRKQFTSDNNFVKEQLFSFNSGLFTKNYNVIIIVDPQTGDIVDANDAACKFYGHPIDTLTAMTIFQINRTPAATVHKRLIEAKSQTSGHFFFEHQLANGDVRDVEVYSSQINLSGQPLLYLMVHDISDYKRTENERNLLERIIASSPDGIIILNKRNTKYTVSFVNQAFEQITGYSQNQVLGKPYQLLFDKRINNRVLSKITRIIHNAKESRLVFKNFRKDDRAFWCELHIKPAETEGKQLTRYLLYMVDITQQKLAEEKIMNIQEEMERRVSERTYEQELAHKKLKNEMMTRLRVEGAFRESEYRYRAVVNGQTEMICRYLPDSTLTFVNEASYRYFGEKHKELLGKSFLDLIPEAEHEHVRKMISELMNETPLAVHEYRDVRADDSIRWLQWSHRIIHGKDDTISEIQAVLRDITDKKMAEESMEKALQTEKELNELRSEFLSTASHEFRTPLATILSSAELLEHHSQLWDDKKKLEHLHRIQQCSKFMNQLIDDLYIIAKSDKKSIPVKLKLIQLNQFFENLARDISSRFFDKYRIKFSFHGSKISVEMDEKILTQIFNNLLSNAVKYSPTGSQIIFNVEQKSSQVICEVIDHGYGIPEENQPHIFEMFHRGANVNNIHGTGLGLTIVMNLLETIGGSIQFTSQLNKGTTFTVTLPVNWKA